MTTVLYDGPTPEYAHAGDAGFDLRAKISQLVEIKPSYRTLIPTGLKLELPPTHFGMIASRSGLAHKVGLVVTNAPGIIDSSYRGEIMVSLQNTGKAIVTILPNDRIAQLLLVPVLSPSHPTEPLHFVPIDHPDQLSPTVRGEGGFGSSGVK